MGKVFPVANSTESPSPAGKTKILVYIYYGYLEYYGTDFAVLRNGAVVPVNEDEMPIGVSKDDTFPFVLAEPGDTIEVITAKKPSLGLYVAVASVEGVITRMAKNASYTITENDAIVSASWEI